MGKQYFLLIIIGGIIVALAVVVAFNLFSSHTTSANRDALVSDLTGISLLAQAYYRKPLKYDGGNNSFKGWQIPQQLASNSNGNYKAEIGNQSITIIGLGKQVGNDGINPVKITMVVGPGEIFSTTINN